MFVYCVSPFEGSPFLSKRSSGTLFNLPNGAFGELCSEEVCSENMSAIFLVNEMACSNYKGLICFRWLSRYSGTARHFDAVKRS